MSVNDGPNLSPFVPDEQYWKEMSGYSDSIFLLSEAGTSLNGLNRRRAMWGGEAGRSQYAIWSSESFGHFILASRLIVANIVEEHIDEEWGGEGNPPPLFSANAAVYTYGTSRDLQRLGRRDVSTSDLFGLGLPVFSEINENLAHGQIFDIKWGRVGLPQTDYDLVLSELGRGASGDYAIPLNTSRS